MYGLDSHLGCQRWPQSYFKLTYSIQWTIGGPKRHHQERPMVHAGSRRFTTLQFEARTSPTLEKCGQSRGVSANGELPGVARSAATGSELKKLLNHAYSAGLAWAYSEV